MFRPRAAPLFLPAFALALGLAVRPPSPGPGVWGTIALCFACAAVPRGRARGPATCVALFAVGALRAGGIPEPAAIPTDEAALFVIQRVDPGDARRRPSGLLWARGTWGRVTLAGQGADAVGPAVALGRLRRGRAERSPPVLLIRALAPITPGSEPWASIRRARTAAGHTVDRAARSVEGRAVLRALVLGESRGIPDRVRGSFARTGTAHLLAISGLHVGLVAAAAALSLRSVLRRLVATSVAPWVMRGGADIVAAGVSVGVAAGYVVLASTPVSSQRAWWMIAAGVVAWAVGRRASLWNVPAVAALAIGCLDPEGLIGVGAGLSFAAVLGLLAAAPALEGLRSLPGPVLVPTRAAAAALVATLATAPLVAHVFGVVPVAGIWANVLAVPAFGALLPVALLGAVLGIVSEPLGAAVVAPAAWGLELCLDGADLLARPGWAPVVEWRPGGGVVAGIYGGWLLLLLRGARS